MVLLRKRYIENIRTNRRPTQSLQRTEAAELVVGVLQEMKKIFLPLLLIGVLIAGCIKTVNRQELDSAINSHFHETISWVSYMGSQDGFHYILHNHTFGSDTYRISEAELKIDGTFPLTDDKNKWRPLKKHWENWQAPNKYINITIQRLEDNRAK